MKLVDVKKGQRVSILNSNGQALEKIGFHKGSNICILKNDGVNPLIISLKDSKVAIGRNIANKIKVK